MGYSKRVDEAFVYAHGLHRDQLRKGNDVPYVTHLMAVAGLVGEFGGDEDQVVAALLHDAVEDQGGHETLEEIRARFGERVANFVDGCTDAYTHPKPPWPERKQAFIDETRGASADLKLIIAADKLHNVRTMISDHANVGEALWDRFTMPRDQTLWYHREIAKALAENWDHALARELIDAVARLDSMVLAEGSSRSPRVRDNR